MYPKVVQELIKQFSQFPHIGPKSAQRFIFYLLQKSPAQLDKLVADLKELKTINRCSVCYNITQDKICSICRDRRRDQSTVCLVAGVPDLAAIEETGEYQGVYHVLGGLIDQAQNIGPEQLRIKSLIKRLEKGNIKEVVFALSPSLNGETTILYLKKKLASLPIRVTRLARGLPMGSDLIYADQITLSSALKDRKPA